MNTTKIIDAIVKLEQQRIRKDQMVILLPYQIEYLRTICSKNPLYKSKVGEPDSFYGVTIIADNSFIDFKVKSLISNHSVTIEIDKANFKETCKCGYTFNSVGTDMHFMYTNCPKCGHQSEWTYEHGKWVEIVGGLH